MAARFHSPVTGWIRSATKRTIFADVGGPFGDKGRSKESHGSVHTLMLEPMPTIQLIPLRRTSLPTSTPRHPWEQELDAFNVMSRSWRQYLPSRVCASKDSGLLRILQVILARSASLNCSISLKPRPPQLFGRVSRFQEAIFRTSDDRSHQNLVNADCICLHRDSRSLKQYIA